MGRGFFFFIGRHLDLKCVKLRQILEMRETFSAHFQAGSSETKCCRRHLAPPEKSSFAADSPPFRRVFSSAKSKANWGEGKKFAQLQKYGEEESLFLFFIPAERLRAASGSSPLPDAAV